MKGKKLITVNQSESRIQSLQFDWTVLLQTEYWKNLVHMCQTHGQSHNMAGASRDIT